MRTVLTVLGILAGGLIFAGSVSVAGAQSTPERATAVRGTVESVDDDLMLSAGARVEIEIIDISGDGNITAPLGRQTINNPGRIPFAFEVKYDPTAVDASSTYGVRVRIYDNGRLMLTTINFPLVITSGNPTDLKVVVYDVATH